MEPQSRTRRRPAARQPTMATVPKARFDHRRLSVDVRMVVARELDLESPEEARRGDAQPIPPHPPPALTGSCYL